MYMFLGVLGAVYAFIGVCALRKHLDGLIMCLRERREMQGAQLRKNMFETDEEADSLLL